MFIIYMLKNSKDIYEDSKYFIRRLQRYDKNFHLDKKKIVMEEYVKENINNQ